MGHCTDCGAPCPHCSAMSEYTLLRVKEPIRTKVKKLLKDVGCATHQRATMFIKELVQYDDKTIDRCFRIWDHEGYVYKGKDERYFLGILKNAAISRQEKLESLPPVAEYPEEDSVEQTISDEVPAGPRPESDAQQELSSSDRGLRESRRPSDSGNSRGRDGYDSERFPNDTGSAGS